MIEDAKFETVTNLEFEKRERTLSSRNSISEEEEEVFAQNGELISPVETEPPHLILLIITIKEGISSLSRILRIFEVRKFFFSFVCYCMAFWSGRESVQFFNCVCIYVLWLDIQLSRAEGCNLNNRFTPSTFCACLKPGTGFPTPLFLVVVFF